MIDLSTTYLGLKLRTPLVVSASPLSHEINGIKRLEDAGASAVVLFSVFEEQLRDAEAQLEDHFAAGKNSFSESYSYFPGRSEFRLGPVDYLNHIRRAKEAVNIPIIASLNCANIGDWTDYARQVEQAGADAIECNIYSIPTDSTVSSGDCEQKNLDIFRAVKNKVNIPVAIKLGPFFTNVAYVARRLDECGADGLVLFNRFYQPDIDLEKLELKPSARLSTSLDMQLPLTWIGMLFGRVHAALAATSGVHTSEDVVKLLMAGANVTMLCSVLLRDGVDHIRFIEEGVRHWMVVHEYESMRQMQGSMSQLRCTDSGAFERAQYIRAVKSLRHVDVAQPREN